MKKSLLTILTILGLTIPLFAAVSVGDPVPKFGAIDVNGDEFNIADCQGRIVFLFFMGYN